MVAVYAFANSYTCVTVMLRSILLLLSDPGFIMYQNNRIPKQLQPDSEWFWLLLKQRHVGWPRAIKSTCTCTKSANIQCASNSSALASSYDHPLHKTDSISKNAQNTRNIKWIPTYSRVLFPWFLKGLPEMRAPVDVEPSVCWASPDHLTIMPGSSWPFSRFPCNPWIAALACSIVLKVTIPHPCKQDSETSNGHQTS